MRTQLKRADQKFFVPDVPYVAFLIGYGSPHIKLKIGTRMMEKASGSWRMQK